MIYKAILVKPLIFAFTSHKSDFTFQTNPKSKKQKGMVPNHSDVVD